MVCKRFLGLVRLVVDNYVIANCKFREHLLSFYLLLGAVGNNRPQKRWSNRYKRLCQSDNRAEKDD